MAASPSPLTDQHLAAINSALEASPYGKELGNKCANVGLDMSAYWQQYSAQEEFFTSVKREFFPDAK